MQRKMEVVKKSWFSLLWENYASDGVSCRSLPHHSFLLL